MWSRLEVEWWSGEHQKCMLQVAGPRPAPLRRLVRVPLERYDEATGTWGTWPDVYRWDVLNEPERFPPAIAGVLEGISVSEPGTDDDGQWYE